MNFGNLIKAFDAVMALSDAARKLTAGSREARADSALTQGTAANSLAGQVEARLTNVVVAALKEAFDRDHARLELERAQLEDQRRRAEEAMRLELRRQAVDREVGRLRFLAAAALLGWLASVLVLGTRAAAADPMARIALGTGWVLLLGSLAAAFSAQGRAGAAVADAGVALDHGPAASAALWLLVTGLAVTALSLLIG